MGPKMYQIVKAKSKVGIIHDKIGDYIVMDGVLHFSMLETNLLTTAANN